MPGAKLKKDILCPICRTTLQAEAAEEKESIAPKKLDGQRRGGYEHL